ncbi:hypothetical protein GGI43DRAFT_404480 [Trichoderma evansii]
MSNAFLPFSRFFCLEASTTTLAQTLTPWLDNLAGPPLCVSFLHRDMCVYCCYRAYSVSVCAYFPPFADEVIAARPALLAPSLAFLH